MIKKITFEISYTTIVICILLSLFWCIVPFFGWSYYSLEGGYTSCSVEWANKNWNVYSYNVASFVFCFIIPLIAIVFCNAHLLLIVNNYIFLILIYFEFDKNNFLKKKRVSKPITKKEKKFIKKERKLTISTISQICMKFSIRLVNSIIFS